MKTAHSPSHLLRFRGLSNIRARFITGFFMSLIIVPGLLAQDIVELLPKAANPRAWMLTAYDTAIDGFTKEADGSFRVDVTRTGKQGWHAELYIGGLNLIEGAEYTLSFKAKADAEREYDVMALLAEDPYNQVSPSYRMKLRPEYQDFSFVFKAARCAGKKVRAPYLPMGLTRGSVWIKDVSLKGPRIQDANRYPVPKGYFPYVLDWNDTIPGTATDVSFLNSTPAGANGRIVVSDGAFRESGTGKRVRFFGTNLVASYLFPDHEDAELIAKRLAKAGINIVRLHGVDAEWSGQSGNIFKRDKGLHAEFEPVQLDRFDYLVYQLKKNGIYVDLNLKVFKTLTELDGFPPDIKDIPFDFQKRVDIFDERMISLQIEHARRILGHVNAYTGKRYADEECVAVVECNNENSLVDYWSDALGTRLDELPPSFKAELVSLWNAWLSEKYAVDAALSKEWFAGVEPLSDSIFSQDTPWFFNKPDDSWMSAKRGKASKGKAAPSIDMDVKKIDGNDWKLQAIISGLTLEEGAAYTVTFSAKTDKARSIALGTQKDGADWHNMGLSQKVAIPAEWTDYAYSFIASAIGKDRTSLVFTVGNEKGRVEIRDVRLMRGFADSSLKKGESLSTSSIPMPSGLSKAARADWIDFLADTERSYADRMRAVVKDEMGCKAQLSVTQIDYGGTTGYNREELMDYTDAHAYWQHPSFPRKPWDPVDWTIGNNPQIGSFSSRAMGEMGRLAMLRTTGRPFSVSEYDQPAPSDYSCEYLPLYSSFASYQDWDMIYTFAMDEYGSFDEPDKINGHFDQGNHPAKWSFYPLAALLFRDGLIPAARSAVRLELAPRPWKRFEYVNRACDALIPSDPMDFLSRSFSTAASSVSHAFGRDAVIDGGRDADSPLTLFGRPSGRIFIAESDSALMCAGYLGGASVDAKNAKLECPAFDGGFASLGIVSLDRKAMASSSRLLLCVAGRVENQGIAWNAERTSIGSNWGSGPCIAQRIPIRINLRRDRPAKVWALNSRGERIKEAKTAFSDNRLSFSPMLEADSLLFELTE
jgi:hypothetical protein